MQRDAGGPPSELTLTRENHRTPTSSRGRAPKRGSSAKSERHRGPCARAAAQDREPGRRTSCSRGRAAPGRSSCGPRHSLSRRRSSRRTQPLPVDQLRRDAGERSLESELFGHEKRRFHRRGQSTAGRPLPGRPDNGSLFLDEISVDDDHRCRSKLLRVLQEKEVRKVERVAGTDAKARQHPHRRRHQSGDRRRARSKRASSERTSTHRINVIPRSTLPPLARSSRGHPAAGRPLHREVRRSDRSMEFRSA